jgi:hypothetical protein
MDCRLCKCPFLDGGLPIAQLDTEAWTNWCLEYLGVHLDQCDEGASWICQFCIMQARYFFTCLLYWKFNMEIFDGIKENLIP